MLMEKNLTTGSVLKSVVLFSLPYLLSYFLQMLYGMADLFIIGQFGDVGSITAVSNGSQVMYMFTVIIVGLAMGTTVTIGQAIGARNKKHAAKNIGNTVTLFMILSVVLTVILLSFIHPIVSVMSTPKEAVNGMIVYLTICFIGLPFITAYNIISSIFRGMGDSKSPMYFIAVACVANIILDYIFIGGLHFGPAGAALGTTLSQAISFIVSLIVTLKRKDIMIEKEAFKPNRLIMGEMLKIGIPIAFQNGLIQVAFIIITIIANLRGLNDSAAVGIVEKVMSFLFLIPSSMLSTVSALGAQNIGAKKPERAIKTLQYAVALTVIFGIIVSIIIQFTAEPIIALFTDKTTIDGAEVVRLGGQYLRGYIWDCIFAGIHFSFSGYFCACGKSELSFLHNILAIILVRIPGAYFTSILFPATLFPMGLATAAGSLLSVLICLMAFIIIHRQNTLILEGEIKDE